MKMNDWNRSLLLQVLALACPLVPTCLTADPLSTWHTRSSPYGTEHDWRAIAFGNGQFVVVNERNGYVIISPNGTDWTPQSIDTTKSLYGLAFGDGQFVAVGNGGRVFTSTDGARWEQQTSRTSAHLYHVSYGNGLFVAVGGGGTILSSPDGANWTLRNTGFTNQWEASAYGNGTHVVVGYRTHSPNIYTRTAASSSLTDWTLTDSGASHYLSAVAYGTGKFVAVGYGGLLQTSTDGVEWSAPADAAHEWLYYLGYDNATFMAVGEDIIVSSTDGVTWTNRYADSTVLNGVAFGNGTWVAVGNEGLILQSDPVAAPSPEPIILTDVTRAGAEFSFVFNGEVGRAYVIQGSSDLMHWASIANLVCTTTPMRVNETMHGTAPQFLRVAQP